MEMKLCLLSGLQEGNALAILSVGESQKKLKPIKKSPKPQPKYLHF